MYQAGLLAFGDHQIHSFGTDKFNVGAGGVEMGVVGDDIAFLAHHAEQDALGGATLMGGNDMPEAKDVLNGIAKAIETLAAGIALVAFHDGGPLMRGHGASAGISEQVDQDIVGRKQKQIVVRGPQSFSRCLRVVQRMGSTLLIRKGSMMVRAMQSLLISN